MNGFDRARLVEAEGMRDVLTFIGGVALEGRYVVTDKGRLARQLQTTVGDVLFNTSRNGAIFAVEVKCEQLEQTGNLFLETWSNLRRYKCGWMFTLETDLLFYYFLATRNLYVASFPALQAWAFQRRRIYEFPEKNQGKYEQLNDTWGRCVPIPVLANEVKLRRYVLPTNGGPAIRTAIVQPQAELRLAGTMGGTDF